MGRFIIMAAGTPVFVSGLKGSAVFRIDTIYPVCLRHLRTIKGPTRAMAVIADRINKEAIVGVIKMTLCTIPDRGSSILTYMGIMGFNANNR
jgi:hypothetical protein